MPANAIRGTIARDEAEYKSLASVARSLSSGKPGRARIVSPDGRHMILPDSLYTVLTEAVRLLSDGQGVSILPAQAQLTTHQAAEILSVSRPHVIKLIDGGYIPCHRVGTHRRIHLADLLAFKRRRDAEARSTLDQLVIESQEAGLYDA